jgi:glycosyltransferase involved in cell wall biosynthesis
MNEPIRTRGAQDGVTRPTVLMLLTNAYDPDPRVRQEALALLSMGCRVRLLAWDRDAKAPEWQEMEGVEVERVFLHSTHGRGTMQLFFYFLLYLRMFWRGVSTNFDAVHCHDLDTLPLGWIMGVLKRRPVIYDAHESFVEMVQGSVYPALARLLYMTERFLIRRTDLLITVGEKLRAHFETLGARRSVVVGNWKNLSEYSRTPEENRAFRERAGIPPSSVAIVCITQLLKNRMIAELVEAARPFDDVVVVLAGRGELEPQVRHWAQTNPRVIYAGFLHAAEVAAWTCACDVVYCGFDTEMPNFRFAAPNKLYEALAAGRPLLAPDAGEIGELLRRSKCGILLKDCSVRSVSEAIAEVRDPEIRGVMTRNALELGRGEMNWDRGRQVLAAEYSRLSPRFRSGLRPSNELSGAVAG